MSILGVNYYITLLDKSDVGGISPSLSAGNTLRAMRCQCLTPRAAEGPQGRPHHQGWQPIALMGVGGGNKHHLRYDTSVTRFYHRITERRGRNKAKVGAARKLLTVCYSLLRYRRPYYNPVHTKA